MTLAELNDLDRPALAEQLRKCCGASRWVERMLDAFPVADQHTLFGLADAVWDELGEADWREAFAHHPKIGDLGALKAKFAGTSTWAAGEQGAVREASDETLQALARGNDEYEQKFGYIFIVCATGKSADEMLRLLRQRQPHAPAAEIRIAAGEQRNITRLRLEKLLSAYRPRVRVA